jgi:hypothetical protein
MRRQHPLPAGASQPPGRAMPRRSSPSRDLTDLPGRQRRRSATSTPTSAPPTQTLDKHHPYSAEYLLVLPPGHAWVPTPRTTSYGHQVACRLQGHVFTLPECRSTSGIVGRFPTVRSVPRTGVWPRSLATAWRAAIPLTSLVPVQPMFSDAERLALAGFLAGYRGAFPAAKARQPVVRPEPQLRPACQGCPDRTPGWRSERRAVSWVIRTVQPFDQYGRRRPAGPTPPVGQPYTVTGTSDQLQPSVLTER